MVGIRSVLPRVKSAVKSVEKAIRFPGRFQKWVGRPLLLVVLVGLLIPERLRIPVEGATSADWNNDSFWYYPWGRSVVHKGIDIFGSSGQAVVSAADGWVVATGRGGRGGNYVLVLGSKWRLHYYAHLKEIGVSRGRFTAAGQVLGWVGATGNAAGKQPHLHYSLVTLIPYPWRFDLSHQGWKKMFFLDPHRRFISIKPSYSTEI